MTVTELPARTAATAAAAEPTASVEAVTSRNPWTTPVHITSLAAGVVAVTAAFAEYADQETLRNWLIVVAGLLITGAFIALEEEWRHNRNTP
jgi:hypothetical protein